MNFVNKYLRNFKPYRVASHKIWQVSQEDRGNILKLDWNEATVNPSPFVKERLIKLIDTDFLNLYPPTYNPELHELLARYVGVPKENIQYFASSDSLHEYISKLFIAVGDPALLVWPSYDNFRLTAEVAGANVMYFNLGEDFKFDLNNFEEIIKLKRPSLVYICNPNNPTGIIIEPAIIEGLLRKFPETMFVVDEAYVEFCMDQTCKNLALKYDNVLITRTMSKAFGLANIRFGYLIASAENVSYISSIRNPKNITLFAQEAVVAALNDVRYMESYVDEVNRAKKNFLNELQKYSVCFRCYESKANFVLVECKSNEIKVKLLDFLTEKNIFVRDTNHSEKLLNCVRVTIGTCNQMKIVASAFEDFYTMINN